MIGNTIKYFALLPFLVIIQVFSSSAYASSYIHLGKHIRLKISNPNNVNISDSKIITIPIKRSKNLILLEGEIDGQQGNFILDTGAPYLILNQTYFRDYFKEKKVEEVSGIIGNTDAYKINIKKLELNGLRYEKIYADLVDLSSIENKRQIKVLGLLGNQLFAKYAIYVDLQKNVLYIHLLDKKGNLIVPNPNFKEPYLKTSFYYSNQVIVITSNIGGRNLNLAFDSAAETNVLDYRQHKDVLKLLNPINRVNLKGIGGSAFEVLYARVNEMQIDTRIFTGNRFLVTNLSQMGKAYGQKIDGMLGYDFFIRGAFYINFIKKEFEMHTFQEEEDMKQ